MIADKAPSLASSAQSVRLEKDDEYFPDWNVDEEILKLENEIAAEPKSLKWEIPKWQFKHPGVATIVLASFASMGGLLSGIDQSLISGANLYMPKSLHLDDNQTSVVSSFMPLGAVFGALMLSPCNEYLGRRYSILIACVFYTIGAALEAGAVNFGMMLAGRLILGAGVGLEGGTVPMYVAESIPSHVRGRVVSLYQFNIALGEVFGYVIAAIFVNVPEGSWRYMLGSSLVFSTIMAIGMLFLPESPRWLMHKHRRLEAFKVWKNIRGLETEACKIEFLEMMRVSEAEQQNDYKQEKKLVWRDFFTVPRARRALIYANIMIFLGQFTGVNAIMYYMSTLLTQIGFDDKRAVFMSLVGGGSLLLGTIPAILYMDRFGRRVWANLMLPGFFIGLVLVGISYFFNLQTQLVSAEATYLTGLILYMGFFGSYSCLTWVIPSEVYPTYLRSYGMTTSSATLFFWSFLVTWNFTRMQKAMTGTGLALGFYGGFAVVGWIYQLLFMPETKNKTLEELEVVFETPTREIVAHNINNLKRFRLTDY